MTPGSLEAEGRFTARIDYRNTWQLNVIWRGVETQHLCGAQGVGCTPSGELQTMYVELDASCLPQGNENLQVNGLACIGLPYMTTTTVNTPVGVPSHAPTFDFSILDNLPLPSVFTGFRFPNTGINGRRLQFHWLPTIMAPSEPLGVYDNYGYESLPLDGSKSIDLGGSLLDDWYLMRGIATSCNDAPQAKEIIKAREGFGSCPIGGDNASALPKVASNGGDASCDLCRGGPINTASGNMTCVDSDPLPGMPLVRVYNENERALGGGFFGTGWNTLLDAWFTSFDEADNRGTVVLELGDDVTRVFRRRGGVYVKVWPYDGGASETLHFDNGAAQFVYRDYRIGREWRFADLHDRLVAVRDMSTGREILITRRTDAIPLRVADSWGNWAWIITMGARGVATVALEGDPSIVWTFTYDQIYARLQSVTGPGGAPWRTYSYAPVPGGMALAEIRDGAGRVIESHSYSGHRATTSLGHDDEITNINYDLPGRTDDETYTEVTYANGRIERLYIRSVAGKRGVVQVEGGCASCGSGDVTKVYDESGRAVRSQDARGWVTEWSYDAATRTAPALVRTQLQPLGCDPASDPGHCRLDPDTLATVSLEEVAESRTTTYVYGDPGWPERATEVREASALVPGEEKRTTTVYATSGQVLSTTVTGWTGDPAEEESRTTTFAYYDGTEGAAFSPGGGFPLAWEGKTQPAGMLKSVDGPRTTASDVTLRVYYPTDASIPLEDLAGAWRGRLAAVKNAAGRITRYENYDAFGNARRVIDPNGVATESTYDGLGRMLTSTIKGVPGCSTSADPICRNDLTATRTYDPATGPLKSETRPGGGATVYAYDTRGRVSTVSRGPNANDLRERIEYQYDPATGNKSVERMLAYEGASWVEKKRESFTYDSFSRLKRTTHPDATFVEYSYDAGRNLTAVQDENHALPNTKYEYDASSRLTEVRQTLGGSEAVTAYAYDDEGNLRSVTDPNGNVTTYVYDDFGQMLEQTSPVTGETTYEYDDGGNLLRTVDARGAVTTRVYDALGRATQSLTTGEGSSETITWGYDAGSFGIGRMTSMTDGLGTVSYTYNRLGLLLTETRPIEGTSYVTKYGYDANGNRTKLTYPSARVIDTTYDYAGRPVTATGKVGNKTTSYVTAASYLPFGPMTSMTYGNGLVKAMTYDARYRLDTVVAAGVADYDYGYDEAGNIETILDGTGAAYNRAYGYDDLNRLTSASGPWGSGSYGYGAMGSMTSYLIGARTGTFSYAGTTPKLTSVVEAGATIPVQYDAAGNELTGTRMNGPGLPSEQRWYTPRNSLHLAYLSASGTKSRPCTVGQACPSAPAADTYYEFGYDGRGVRTIERKRTGSTLTTKHYAYSPELSFLGHKAPGSKGTGIEAVWFAGAPIAQEVWGTHGQTKWTFTDHLGTPLLQTNSSKAVVWRAEYEPYGNVIMRMGTKDEQPLRFPGQERLFDGSTGTEERYNIFRWYRSAWGRYTQADPLTIPSLAATAARSVNSLEQLTSRINFPQSQNEFGYVAGSPAKSSDRLGLLIDFDCAKRQVAPAAEKARLFAQSPSFPGGLSGEGNGPADAFRHCYWSCLMRKNCGLPTATAAGIGHELYDDRNQDHPWFPGEREDRRMDWFNNSEGLDCGGQSCSGCDMCCLRKVFNNELWDSVDRTMPPGRYE